MANNAREALKVPEGVDLKPIFAALPEILDAAVKVADFVEANDNIPLLASIKGPAALIDAVLHAADGLAHNL